jgi:hypothetical protein
MLKTKTAQIVDVAKTKLTKYGEDNKRLQQLVDQQQGVKVADPDSKDTESEGTKVAEFEVSMEAADLKVAGSEGTKVTIDPKVAVVTWLEHVVALSEGHLTPAATLSDLEADLGVVLGEHGRQLAHKLGEIVASKQAAAAAGSQ